MEEILHKLKKLKGWAPFLTSVHSKENYKEDIEIIVKLVKKWLEDQHK